MRSDSKQDFYPGGFSATFPFLFPFLDGCFTFHTELKKHTWLGVEGPCWGIFEPRHVHDLSFFLKSYKGPYTILGAGSNLLVHDEGIQGIVIKLQKGFHLWSCEAG